MTDREQKKTREKLNKDLKDTLDKEEVRDLDPPPPDQDKLRGGIHCGGRTRER